MENIQLFEYKSPADLLKRLNRQFDYWANDSMNTDKALDFCLSAWSLADWDFYFKNPDLIGEKKQNIVRPKLAKYREELFKLCEELKIMSDIANGTKHFSLSHPIAIEKISTVSLKVESAFSTAFAWGPGIKINFDDGSRRNLSGIIKKTHQFWNQYLISDNVTESVTN